MLKNKPSFVNIALHILGLSFCILPPALATLLYFPVWVESGGGYALAGGGVLILAIFALPIIKRLSHLLARATPYVFWFVMFAVFFALSKISEEMTVISFMGFLGNLIGALIFKAEERKRKNEEGRI